MTDALDRLTTLRSEIEHRRQQMKEAAQEAVKEGTRAIFEEYGDILAKFGWVQYTPYFNDGDPCEFSMHELALIEKGDAPEDDDGYDEDEGFPYESSGGFNPYSDQSKISDRYGTPDERYVRCKGACEQVYKALEYGDLALDIFGDHVVVTFTPDGVDVDDHGHD